MSWGWISSHPKESHNKIFLDEALVDAVSLQPVKLEIRSTWDDDLVHAI
jgi:hypothetical protein